MFLSLVLACLHVGSIAVVSFGIVIPKVVLTLSGSPSLKMPGMDVQLNYWVLVESFPANE
jgi:hypothetical protein